MINNLLTQKRARNKENEEYFDIPEGFHLDETKKTENFFITLPTNHSINRTPGTYEDVYSKFKVKHNLYIMNSCRLLQAITKEKGGIRALLLDGKFTRTTYALLKLKEKIGRIYIVEINKETFDLITKNLKDYHNISIFNQHIGDFVNMNIDPYINVAYFDVMCSFFTSEKTEGSETIIKKFLAQSKVNEMIFAATFCLRSSLPIDFVKQKRKILSKLKILFLLFGFKPTMLTDNNEVIYKGQRANNQGMMFVLFYLIRE